jgi:hypothetical protein
MQFLSANCKLQNAWITNSSENIIICYNILSFTIDKYPLFFSDVFDKIIVYGEGLNQIIDCRVSAKGY